MTYRVAVRTLCEFAAKHGDLDLRFTPSPSAQQGIAGHAELSSRRGASYQREVSLQGNYQQLQVNGRADGFDPRGPSGPRVEEIKTHRGDLLRQPENHRFLHWAQAKVYGHLLCETLGLAEIEVALVYFDISSKNEQVICEVHSATALQQVFESLCDQFLRWAISEAEHREKRDAAIDALQFPHGSFRTGQHELASAVYKANLSGRILLAQAPTGIGKTIATLFPLIKACHPKAIDKLFYLTAKTPGRQLALDALSRIQEQEGKPSKPLRVLELVARDKACEHPDKACHGESCPLAKGFYDRLAKARQAAVAVAVLDKSTLRAISADHAVCPYYLGQDLVRWSDVIIGDYNHYFDSSAMLYGLSQSDDLRVSLLVDEAHNLIDRARKMYTAQLSQQSVRQLRKAAPEVLRRPLTALANQWNKLVKEHQAPYQVIEELPEKFLLALQKLAAALSDYLAEHPSQVDADLQGFYFEILQFQRIYELHGPHALIDITRDNPRQTIVCLRNVQPGPLLKPRWAGAHSATLFSATLSPFNYVSDLLGLPDNTVAVDLPSPFSADQLSVRLTRHISTRYRDRTKSCDNVVRLMAEQYRAQPGNYLAFFSSFEYMDLIAARLAALHPEIVQWSQSRGMGEAAREAFVGRFVADGSGIGFAVLGGAFGEGIDLPGTRLIGAFIATLGMAQVNPVNEQFRERIEALTGQGYDYVYLFPGLQKVIQAVGRVIRTPQDRGVVFLMDDRFCQPPIRRMLPAWWDTRLVTGS